MRRRENPEWRGHACLPTGSCLHGEPYDQSHRVDGGRAGAAGYVATVGDPALLSATPGHLAGACAQLARLDQPAVVSPKSSRTPIRVLDNTDPDRDRPARLLERHYEHRRVQALTVLAANPHTPHAAVVGVLGGLHPAEPARIAEKADGPDWFLAAAAAIPVPEDEDDGVVRLVDDDELGKQPDPAAVLQSWLDSPATGEILSRSEVYRAVAKSRYRTLEHLRQIPAAEVLANHEPDVALTILLDRCGRSTDRWGTRRCHDLRLRRREDHLRGTPRLLGPDARRGADILTVGRTVGSRDSCHTTLL